MFRGCGLPPRRSLLVFRFRRITPADPPQYAFDRHRPGAMGPQRAAAIPCGASHLRRDRTGPVTDSQTHHQLPAQRSCGGPGYQSAHGQHPERSAEHADAAGRFSEDPGDHDDLHQFDRGGGLGSQRADVSSLMDTWLLLKNIEVGGERNRALYVLKSRGMEHSNQIREFVLTNHGLRLLDVYLGPDGVLTGSARVSQEGREKAAGTSRRQHLEGRGRELDRKREIFEARMTMLRAEFEVEEEVIQQSISESKSIDKELLQDRGQMVRSREADKSAYKNGASTPPVTAR